MDPMTWMFIIGFIVVVGAIAFARDMYHADHAAAARREINRLTGQLEILQQERNVLRQTVADLRQRALDVPPAPAPELPAALSTVAETCPLTEAAEEAVTRILSHLWFDLRLALSDQREELAAAGRGGDVTRPYTVREIHRIAPKVVLGYARTFRAKARRYGYDDSLEEVGLEPEHNPSLRSMDLDP